jgi:hypothetical protein
VNCTALVHLRLLAILVACHVSAAHDLAAQVAPSGTRPGVNAATAAASASSNRAPAPGATEQERTGGAAPASLPGEGGGEQRQHDTDDHPLRLSLDFMAGYGHDGANAPLGFEKQGRIGYIILTVEGQVHRSIRYRMSVNPVDEVEPLPGCGEEGFFYPNNPQFLYDAGPVVPCNPKNGNRRVDGYRGIALDVVPQQGPVREAFVEIGSEALALRFGRTILPLGFGWQEAGSLSAKDASRIQRINAEANFGLLLGYRTSVGGRVKPLFSGNAGGYLGEGNRWWDYDYFYFEDGSLDSNSALGFLLSGSFSPDDRLEVRGAFKRNFTGSKVERLPSYWASKRNDHAVTFGAEYRVNRYARVLGELARYTWGPTATSAEMLGVSTAPITKSGYYVTAEGSVPIRRDMTIGASVTREEIDRADSLVRFLAANGLFGVEEGRKDRMTVARLFFDINGRVRLGLYRNADSNPFPQASGIWPVAGPKAYTGRNTDKWGLIVRLRAG